MALSNKPEAAGPENPCSLGYSCQNEQNICLLGLTQQSNIQAELRARLHLVSWQTSHEFDSRYLRTSHINQLGALL